MSLDQHHPYSSDDDDYIDIGPCLTENFSLKLSLLPHKLYWQSRKSYDHLWVFWWSKDEGRHTIPTTSINDLVPDTPINRWTISEKIKTALSNFNYHDDQKKNFNFHYCYAIQFWAPVMRENNRCILTTYDQPFGLSRLQGPILNYMMQSKNREINVDGGREDELGPIGRVFRNKLPEFIPDIRSYSNKEFPTLSETIACGVQGILAFPVFDPLSRFCVGVLEFVEINDGFFYRHEVCYEEACRVLKEAALGSLDMVYHLNEEIPFCLPNALDEIRKGLELVCSTHKLPAAQAWIPCGQNISMPNGGNLEKSYNSFGLSFNEEVMIAIAKSEDAYGEVDNFSAMCKYRPLRKGEGLVGKALLSHKPCFCIDIAKVSIIDDPLARCAEICKLSRCFSICLRNINTGNRDYVLEFFLPRKHTDSVQNLLPSILATMKQHFPSFKAASGEELGEELFAKVIEFWTNDEPDSFKACKTTRSLPLSESPPNEDKMEQLVSSSQQSSMENAIQNEKNIAGAEQGDITDTDLKKTCKTSKKEHKKTENSISKEVIKGYFGWKLEDAAESLSISRSTLKRLCRDYDIPKWPYPKKNKDSHAQSNNEHVDKFVQGGEKEIPESSGRGPLCSDQFPKLPTAVVAHTTPHVTPMQDASTVTIKAKYRDDTLRFQLSSSSGMADLKEKVTKRVPLLNDIPFIIKYLDDEGEWVLIACDEDLQDCMGSCSSLNKTPIKMLVQAIAANQAP